MNSEPIGSQASQALAQKAPFSQMTEKGLVKLRPKGLALVIALLCTDNVLSLGYNYPDQWNSAGKLAALFSIKLLWLWIYWYLWKGRNWARLLTVISSCALMFLPFFPHSHIGTMMQVYRVAETVFNAYLLYWLNTKSLIRFFKAPGNGTSELPPGS